MKTIDSEITWRHKRVRPVILGSCAFALLFLVMLGMAACGSGTNAISSPPMNIPTTAGLTGNVGGVHDPSMAKQGSTYYVFSTDVGDTGHLPIRCSNDLQAWTQCGRIFDAIPAWIQQAIPGITSLWAPDVSYFSGRYHLYYAASTFGSNRSIIALATNITLDPSSSQYQWADEGAIIQSYPQDDWNAIDPNIFLDDNAQVWMAFGSYWSGIKMRRIDPATGGLSSADTTLYSLASRSSNPPAIEAAFVFHHGNYYYLFVSFDFCCRGAASTYKIMFGRASQVTGPYVDQTSTPMLSGGGTLLLQGSADWRGPGGQSLLHDLPSDLIVFHAYDSTTGKPFLQLGKLSWDNDWPQLASWQHP